MNNGQPTDKPALDAQTTVEHSRVVDFQLLPHRGNEAALLDENGKQWLLSIVQTNGVPELKLTALANETSTPEGSS